MSISDDDVRKSRGVGGLGVEVDLAQLVLLAQLLGKQRRRARRGNGRERPPLRVTPRDPTSDGTTVPLHTATAT